MLNYDKKKSADELRLSSEKLTQVLTEMAKLNLQKIDFNQIRDTLVKGIKALADVREQWGKLTSLKDFVDTAKSGREIQMKDYKIPISDIFRDVIFEEASKASQIAYVVRTISCTYVQISNEHLMDKITSLGSLIALDPKLDGHVIQRRRGELHDGCAAAQRSIHTIVLKKSRV
ncbi:unnamed protein product [Mytilus edulis]|uniref:Uncharacterized protein n=1 Tax=Mytilus edulis TaxID=6550 RepID=A0A8S3U1G2_MYTED|nr:unnamed protein product [Mytilus edulis]